MKSDNLYVACLWRHQLDVIISHFVSIFKFKQIGQQSKVICQVWCKNMQEKQSLSQWSILGAFGPSVNETLYRKIPILGPWLIFVEKAVLLRLFSGELIFGGTYYWKEFYVSKWVGLDSNMKQAKTLPKQPKQPKTAIALTVQGLIFGRAYYRKDFCVWDLGAYFREGLFLGGLLSEFYGT